MAWLSNAVTSRVAVSPSMPGMRMSISTRSGASRAASETAVAPSPTLADHGQVGFGVDDRGESGPDHRLVVDDHHAYGDGGTS